MVSLEPQTALKTPALAACKGSVALAATVADARHERPAIGVQPTAGTLTWLVDEEAASQLTQWSRFMP